MNCYGGVQNDNFHEYEAIFTWIYQLQLDNFNSIEFFDHQLEYNFNSIEFFDYQLEYKTCHCLFSRYDGQL